MKWLVGIEGILSKFSIIPYMHEDHEQLAKYCPLKPGSFSPLDLGSRIRFPECTVSHTKEVSSYHTSVHNLDPLSIHNVYTYVYCVCSFYTRNSIPCILGGILRPKTVTELSLPVIHQKPWDTPLLPLS